MGVAFGVSVIWRQFYPFGSARFVRCPESRSVVSRRLTMYYIGSDFNPCHGLCGGCPPLGGSVMGGSTVSS